MESIHMFASVGSVIECFPQVSHLYLLPPCTASVCFDSFNYKPHTRAPAYPRALLNVKFKVTWKQVKMKKEEKKKKRKC